MIPSDAFMDLIAIGYRVEYGYLFFDRYRYGRISEDALLTEGDPSVPIPWTEIAGFEDTDQGSFGHNLSIVRPDGSKTELKRSELPAAEKYSGLRPKKDLAAVLCSGSFPEDPGIPTAVPQRYSRAMDRDIVRLPRISVSILRTEYFQDSESAS